MSLFSVARRLTARCAHAHRHVDARKIRLHKMHISIYTHDFLCIILTTVLI